MNQAILNLNIKKYRKPKPLIKIADRRASFAFKRNSEIPALIEQCSRDPKMLVINFPRVFRKLKKSKEREKSISAGQMCGE